MDVCTLQFKIGNIALFLAFLACIIPMIFGRRIRGYLDPYLYNDKHWPIEYENSIPFPKHRRAMVYFAAVGMKPLARHRFPDINLDDKVPFEMKLFGFIVFMGMFVGLGLAVVYGINRFLICG